MSETVGLPHTVRQGGHGSPVRALHGRALPRHPTIQPLGLRREKV